MSPEALTALFVAVGEVFAAIREALTKRRKEQASAALPDADLLDAHIRQLVAEALERARSRPLQPHLALAADHPLAVGADGLKSHIDALVSEALQRAHDVEPPAVGCNLPATSDPNPSAAGAAPPETAVEGGEPEAGAIEKSGPASP